MTRPQSSLMPDDTAQALSTISSSSNEARQAARNVYPYSQRYALYREGRWPTDDEFKVAELCDISSQGLALFLKVRPAAQLLVVELGVGTNVSQVLVKIVQIAPVALAGEQGFRVGCELVAK